MSGNAEAPPRQLTNLQLRVISAVLLGVGVLAVTLLDGIVFRLLAAAIAVAIFYEWSRMVRPRVGRGLGLLPDILVLAFAAVLVGGSATPLLLAAAGGFAALCAAAALWRRRGAWESAGLAYAMLSGLALALVRDSDQSGLLATLFLFAVVWATDIFAYFVGRAVGGAKLAPAISPGKTWSGALGGAVGGVVAGLIVALASGTGAGIGVLAAAVVLSVVSQAGDLFESWVKRRNGVKDFSRIIPGHGGVMDRVDGLVAAAIALWLIGWMGGSVEHPAHTLFGG